MKHRLTREEVVQLDAQLAAVRAADSEILQGGFGLMGATLPGPLVLLVEGDYKQWNRMTPPTWVEPRRWAGITGDCATGGRFDLWERVEPTVVGINSVLRCRADIEVHNITVVGCDRGVWTIVANGRTWPIPDGHPTVRAGLVGTHWAVLLHNIEIP